MIPRYISAEPWIIDYNNTQFFQIFRMTKNTFDLLVNVIRRLDDKKIMMKKYSGGHYPVSIQMQILIFLWYMANPDSLRCIGIQFKVSPPTVMQIVNRVLYFMLLMKKSYIKFPSTEGELQTVSRGFRKYPGAVGAVDGTHIFILVEKEQQDSYIDRYRRHSINIMGICDANTLFTYIFVGFPGSAHDSRVFENSQFCQQIATYGPNSIFLDANMYHLIGDSAFGVRKWLMTPYRDNNHLTRKQKHHNYCLSSDRVVIEHAFGLLKGRWRRLQFISTYNICKTIDIATSGCVLHNFCILNADFWNEEIAAFERLPGVAGENQVEGVRKRENMANYLFFNQI